MSKTPNNDITVAAYYYPGYHCGDWSNLNDPTAPGEMSRVRDAKPLFEGQWQPRIPLWGYAEDESDPKVMEKKIDTAVKYGVNCFAFDWYWYGNKPHLVGCIRDGFLKANNIDKIDFYLMWANHEQPKPGYDFEVFKAVVDNVIKEFMKHPSYYKINGNPVFCIYDVGVFLKDLGGAEKAGEAVTYFRSELKKAGFPGLHLQCIIRRVQKDYSGFDGGDTAYRCTFDDLRAMKVDSITNYQFAHLAAPESDFIKWADASINQWDLLGQQEFPYFPHVSIGWDNTCRHPDELTANVKDNVNPKVFKRYLQKAKDYVNAHPNQPKLVTINAWNEWVEGSNLEPDTRFGFGYLEAVRDVFVSPEKSREPPNADDSQ